MMMGPRYNSIDAFVPYSPIVDRPIIRWPNNAGLAIWIAANVELYEFQPVPSDYYGFWTRSSAPDVLSYSYREYGNRVGFWRMLEVLDGYNVPITASLNLGILELRPEIRDAMVERNWELMSHGLYNTRMLYGMEESHERQFYRDSIALAEKFTGKRLRGMFGPAGSMTPATPRLMAQAGFLYQVGWFIDDQPFPIVTDSPGSLVGIPYAHQLNDGLVFKQSAMEGEEFYRMLVDAVECLRVEGASSGRVLCIGLHPYLIGQPHRIDYLDRMLAFLARVDSVWMATAGEIADWYIAHYYESAVSNADER